MVLVKSPVLIGLVLVGIVVANVTYADDVRRSRNGLCHDKTSHSFGAMKHYDQYDSMTLCLAVPGSRLPKHMENASTTHSLSNITALSTFNQKRYDRDNWKHWNEGVNVNDCVNTRHETLARLAFPQTVRMSRDGCYVSAGQWYDAYSGDTFYDPRKLEIDNVIPLFYTFKHGGANWSKEKKEMFSNDPINLIAVSASLNRQKSAKGPSEWLPPNYNYRCEYLARWQQVLSKYPTIVMPASERRIVGKMARACIGK